MIVIYFEELSEGLEVFLEPKVVTSWRSKNKFISYQ
jgi:hypothetical protein